MGTLPTQNIFGFYLEKFCNSKHLKYFFFPENYLNGRCIQFLNVFQEHFSRHLWYNMNILLAMKASLNVSTGL